MKHLTMYNYLLMPRFYVFVGLFSFLDFVFNGWHENVCRDLKVSTDDVKANQHEQLSQ